MKQNFSVNENVSIIDLVSGIKIPDCSKLAKNGKNGDEVIICRNEVTVKFFWSCRNSFVEFRHWLKFHVNIMTVLGLRQFLFIRNLTRNPETKNTRVWVLSNIRRQGQFNSTWFGMNVSNEKLLVATKMSPASLHLLPFPSR